MTDPKPLPKSLHTVTVLVKMALVYEATRFGYTMAEIVADVVADLGLAGKPDTHGLIEAALKQLEK